MGFYFLIMNAYSIVITFFTSIDFVEDIFEALTEFFFILRDGNSAGIVVSILVWIILTIVGEIWITQEYE